jgi:hypothetical protein
MHDQDMFRKSVKWHQQGGGSEEHRSPTSRNRVLGLSMTLVVLSALLIRLLVHAAVSGTTQVETAPTPQPAPSSVRIIVAAAEDAVVPTRLPIATPVMTPTPSCIAVDSYLRAGSSWRLRRRGDDGRGKFAHLRAV